MLGGEHARELAVLKGPRGECRPGDAIGAAIKVAKFATGEIEENLEPKSGRTRSGRAGATAGANKLSGEERREITRKAATTPWHSDK
jgi:hypothetical protein